MALTPEQEALVIALISRTQKTISQLEAETALVGDKILPVENGSRTFALSVDDLKDYIEENLSSATTSSKGVVELATNAQVAAGTDAQRAVTIAALASLFNNSLRAKPSGYIRIPVKVGGAFVEMIIQFGQSSVTASDTNTTVTLPLTYPNSNLIGLATALNSDSSTTKDGVAQVVSLSTSQIVVRNNGVNTSTTSFSIYWLSIGY